jgi:hypothetical protein
MRSRMMRLPIGTSVDVFQLLFVGILSVGRSFVVVVVVVVVVFVDDDEEGKEKRSNVLSRGNISPWCTKLKNSDPDVFAEGPATSRFVVAFNHKNPLAALYLLPGPAR